MASDLGGHETISDMKKLNSCARGLGEENGSCFMSSQLPVNGYILTEFIGTEIFKRMVKTLGVSTSGLSLCQRGRKSVDAIKDRQFFAVMRLT